MKELKELDRAFAFALTHHSGQARKFTGIPYFTHLTAGVRYLSNYGIDDEKLLCAMALHDVVEDTDNTIEDIERLFGKDITDIVAQVTLYDKDKKDKKAFLQNLADNGSAAAVILKAVDRIVNTEDFFLPGQEKKAREYALEASPVFARASHLVPKIGLAVKRLARLLGMSGYALFQLEV